VRKVISISRIMNRTTTVIVALIAAAGLSTIIYALPEQQALAWHNHRGGVPFIGGCGPGCGVPFIGGGGYQLP
jgi:hypothetical protein